MIYSFPTPVAPRRGSLIRRFPEVLPPFAAAAAVLLAALSLVGWHFRIPQLREPMGGFMAPNAALCFLLLSTAIITLRWRDRRWAQALGPFCAAFVIAFSGVILFEHITQINTGLAQIFFRHRLADWDLPGVPGRFAPNSALTFVLYGLALLFIYRDRSRSFSQSLTGFGLIISLLALAGHAYGIEGLYSVYPTTYMAGVSATVFVLVGFGILFSVARGGWMGVVLRDDAAGLLSRRILVITYLVYPVIGYGVIEAIRHGYIGPPLATAVMVVTALVLVTSTMFRTAREMRRLDRERRIVQDRLRDAEKLAATGRLAATLAHEVNNPLEAVTNILYLLNHDPGVSQQSREFLALADDELTRVSHITRQTLAFYRESTQPVPTNIGELVSRTISIFQPKIEAKNITVRLDSQIEEEVLIFPGELKQVFTNLLSNAIDACDIDGKIHIRVSPGRSWNSAQENGVRITVADDGVGISVKHKKHLFQPFFTTKGQKGTGLGLWVSHGLISKHSGSLRVRTSTEAKRGTTFSLFLPVKITQKRRTRTAKGRISRTAAS